MNDVRIRIATANDAARIIDIHARSIRVLCRDDYRDEQIEAWIGKRKPEDMIAPIERHPYIIAEKDGQPIGYAAYSRESGHLLSVFVDPDYARQGVASLMMDELLADARRTGLTAMWLHSSLTAVPLYETFGFERVKAMNHAFGDVSLECWRMELSLTD